MCPVKAICFGHSDKDMIWTFKITSRKIKLFIILLKYDLILCTCRASVQTVRQLFNVESGYRMTDDQ